MKPTKKPNHKSEIIARIESGEYPACLKTRFEPTGKQKVKIEIDMPGKIRGIVTVWDYQVEESLKKYSGKNPKIVN